MRRLDGDTRLLGMTTLAAPEHRHPPGDVSRQMSEHSPRLVYTELRSPLAGTVGTSHRLPDGCLGALLGGLHPADHMRRRVIGVLTALVLLLGATTSEADHTHAAESAGLTAPMELQDLLGTWVSPTPGESPEVARPFVAPPSPWGAGHRGVDLAAAPGSTITAPAEGTVSFVGVVVDRPVLSVDHGAGFISSFEPIDSELEVGDAVAAGDPLGELAAGGHCDDGSCVHWGVRLHGEYINPLLLLDELEPSVLLPVER